MKAKRREAPDIAELKDADRSRTSPAQAEALADLLDEIKLLASLKRCPLDHLHHILIYCPECGLER